MSDHQQIIYTILLSSAQYLFHVYAMFFLIHKIYPIIYYLILLHNIHIFVLFAVAICLIFHFFTLLNFIMESLLIRIIHFHFIHINFKQFSCLKLPQSLLMFSWMNSKYKSIFHTFCNGVTVMLILQKPKNKSNSMVSFTIHLSQLLHYLKSNLNLVFNYFL